MIGLIGKKLGMTQIFTPEGKVIPVTVVKAGPCQVIQRKTVKNDGYDAVQLGYEQLAERKTKKPLQGHFKKFSSPNFRYIKEFRLSIYKDIEQGEVFDVSMFEENEILTARGVSKGKGFTGVIKRHGFHGFKQTHGVHESFRGPGSIGMCATPGHVLKGKKLPGHKGVEKITVKNLKVIKVDVEKNLLMIKGALPGHRNSIVLLEKEI